MSSLIRILLLACSLIAAAAGQATITAASDLVSGSSPFAGHALYGHRAGDPKLRQWVFVSITSYLQGQALVEVDDGVENVPTSVNLTLGPGSYQVFGRTRWPAGPTSSAVVRVVVNGNPVATLQGVSLGSRRPWTCHLVSETCDDDIYGFDRKADELAASRLLMKAELDRMDADDTAGRPDLVRNRFLAVHYRSIEDLLASDPAEISRVVGRLAQRRLEMSAFPNTNLAPALSSSEIVRQMLPAARIERAAPGFRMTGALYQETPNLPFGLATVLAGSGILGVNFAPFGVSYYPGEAGPIEYWEGPDGSRVFWHFSAGYTEARGKTWMDLLAKAATIYERFAPAVYPWSAYVVSGTYGDLAPATWQAAGASGITAQAAWAALQASHPGAEYPRLTSSTHSSFFEQLDQERAQNPGIDAGVPVRRGDLGADWEAWPLGLACYAHQWRQSLALLPAMDVFAALTERFYPGFRASVAPALTLAQRETSRLSDHAWNGNTLANRLASAGLRKSWSSTAVTAARSVLDQATRKLTSGFATGAEPCLVVFNKESFAASGAAQLNLTAAGLGSGPYRVQDLATGAEHAAQITTTGASSTLTVDCGLVPPFGLRTFKLVSGAPSPELYPVRVTATGGGQVILESVRQRMVVDVAQHRATNLADKIAGYRELIPAGRPLGLSREAEFFAPEVTDGTVTAIRTGPLFGELELTGTGRGLVYTTRIRLYTALPGIEWEIKASGAVTVTKGPVFHAGVATLGASTYVQGPAAVFKAGVAPSGEQIPGAGLNYHAVDRFLDLTGSEAGMVVAPSQCGIAFVDGLSRLQRTAPGAAAFPLFGPDWTSYPQEKLTDQNGETEMTFRFDLLPHGPGSDHARAYRFASSAGRHGFPTLAIPANQPGVGHSGLFSGGSVQSAGVVATTFALSDETPARGLVLQVWDVGGSNAGPVTLELDLLGGIQGGNRTDLLERDLTGSRNDLVVQGNRATLPLRGRGLGSARLFPGTSGFAPVAQIQSVQPALLPNLVYPPILVQVKGPGVGAAVAVKVGNAWVRELRVVGPDQVEVPFTRAENLGNTSLVVLSPSGMSAPFPIVLAAAVPPALRAEPVKADAAQHVMLEVGSEAGDIDMVFASPIAAPFPAVPGSIEFAIGGPGGRIFLLGSVLADARGIALFGFQNPGLQGTPIFVQSLIVRFSGTALVLPTPMSAVAGMVL